MAGTNVLVDVSTTRRLRCSTCSLLKSRDQFHVRGNRARGASSRCKECESARKRVAYDAGGAAVRATVYRRDAEAVWANKLWTFYRLRPEQYFELLRAQNEACALCKRPESALNPVGAVRRLAVDHDHACCPGKKSCGRCVRGLLCTKCNNGLGGFNDDPALLRAALVYVGGD